MSQIKDGSLGVNGLGVFGTAYIQNKLGINDDTPAVALQINGTIIVGNGGEVCQAVTKGGIRFNDSTDNLEYCDGASWKQIGSTVQYMAYVNPGTYTFEVPSSLSSLTAAAYGAGGGGGFGATSGRCTAGPDGGNGQNSSFGSLVATGGKGGKGSPGYASITDDGAPGADGGGSGGDVVIGGGASGGEGGTFGPGGTMCSSGGDGGKGGLATHTFSREDLTSGSIQISVGQGGAGATASGYSYGTTGGSNGGVFILWN